MWQPQPTRRPMKTRHVSLSGRLGLAFPRTARFIHWSWLASAAFPISGPSGPVHAHKRRVHEIIKRRMHDGMASCFAYVRLRATLSAVCYARDNEPCATLILILKVELALG